MRQKQSCNARKGHNTAGKGHHIGLRNNGSRLRVVKFKENQTKFREHKAKYLDGYLWVVTNTGNSSVLGELIAMTKYREPDPAEQ